MKYAEGAPVVTGTGERAGDIKRVVVDPVSCTVTHIVVRKGVLFPTDKVVPVAEVARADDDAVWLRKSIGDPDELPDFEEEVYVPVTTGERERSGGPDSAPQLYAYNAHVGGPMGLATEDSTRFLAQPRRNIPPGTVALEKGATVVDPAGTSVGEVVDVVTRDESERLVGIVVSEGLLRKEERLVPADWIQRIDENEVHVAVGAEFLRDSVPEYQG